MNQRQLTVEQSASLLEYLFASLELKHKAVKNLLKFGAVSVNGATTRQFDAWLSPGDEVTIGDLSNAAASDRLSSAGIRLVYEDDCLLVVDKPAGLLTVATDNDKTDTLFFRLSAFLRNRDSDGPGRALVVHRLDRETSGLVLFAKNASSREALQNAWPLVEKTYVAVVERRPKPAHGTITNYLIESKSLRVRRAESIEAGARLATTHYRQLQTRGDLSLVEVRLETGRKHQIRVHLAGLGCPVAGDRRYGAKADPCGRLALHASSLAFSHPVTGERLSLESPLPKAFARLFH